MQYPESISTEELTQLDHIDFNGPIVVVSDVDEDFAEAIDYLRSQTVIGFDTETKPSFSSGSPRHHVALLQLSGGEKAYIFRLNMLGLPAPLASLLSDGNILKIGAAVKDDVRGLMYYRKFTPRRHHPGQEGVQDAAALQLGGAAALGRPAQVCGHRRMGLPRDVSQTQIGKLIWAG